jgi:MOSC domain-containing protein YiiM
MEGIVVSISIAPIPGAPMILLKTAHLVPGKGIEGDRFYGLNSSQSANDEVIYEVTLVEQEALEALWNGQPSATQEGSARRNIVVRGCSLRALAGHTFRIGEVILRGLVRHDSCYSQDTEQADACASLYGADLGAQILTEGSIAVGDRVQVVLEPL